MDLEEWELKLPKQWGGYWHDCHGGWDWPELSFCTEDTEKLLEYIWNIFSVRGNRINWMGGMSERKG